MANSIVKTLNKFKTNEGDQKSKLQGIANKVAGIKIVTDPRVTPKGNRTCTACLVAKRTGTPLPPQHANCRCYIKKV